MEETFLPLPFSAQLRGRDWWWSVGPAPTHTSLPHPALSSQGPVLLDSSLPSGEAVSPQPEMPGCGRKWTDLSREEMWLHTSPCQFTPAHASSHQLLSSPPPEWEWDYKRPGLGQSFPTATPTLSPHFWVGDTPREGIPGCGEGLHGPSPPLPHSLSPTEGLSLLIRQLGTKSMQHSSSEEVSF